MKRLQKTYCFLFLLIIVNSRRLFNYESKSQNNAKSTRLVKSKGFGIFENLQQPNAPVGLMYRKLSVNHFDKLAKQQKKNNNSKAGLNFQSKQQKKSISLNTHSIKDSIIKINQRSYEIKSFASFQTAIMSFKDYFEEAFLKKLLTKKFTKIFIKLCLALSKILQQISSAFQKIEEVFNSYTLIDYGFNSAQKEASLIQISGPFEICVSAEKQLDKVQKSFAAKATHNLVDQQNVLIEQFLELTYNRVTQCAEMGQYLTAPQPQTKDKDGQFVMNVMVQGQRQMFPVAWSPGFNLHTLSGQTQITPFKTPIVLQNQLKLQHQIKSILKTQNNVGSFEKNLNDLNKLNKNKKVNFQNSTSKEIKKQASFE